MKLLSKVSSKYAQRNDYKKQKNVSLQNKVYFKKRIDDYSYLLLTKALTAVAS